LIADRLSVFASILATLPRGTLADLGAGHCAFSRVAHAAGFAVTSIDARTTRVPPDITWPFRHEDVRTTDLSSFEIIAMLGLLYHLPLDDQIDLLRRCAGKTVIVDTHVAERATVTVGEYAGSYFDEVPEGVDLARVPTASWGNRRSFWHTRESLIRLFERAGFRVMPWAILPGTSGAGRAWWVGTA
jgi:hypothetical protein